MERSRDDETVQPALAGACRPGEPAGRPRRSQARRAVRASAVLMTIPFIFVEVYARDLWDPYDHAVE